MYDSRRPVPDEIDWLDVSERRPCPICGERTGCRTHADSSFAGCARRPSDWPLVNGLWLHRVDAVAPDTRAASVANFHVTAAPSARAVVEIPNALPVAPSRHEATPVSDGGEWRRRA